MASAGATHLMFEGTAEKAMSLYVSLFPASEIKGIERYGPGEQGAEGSIKRADCILAGHRLICIDSPVKHGFTFTPSMSLFIDCANEAELNETFKQLSDGGRVLMPPDNYGFSKSSCGSRTVSAFPGNSISHEQGPRPDQLPAHWLTESWRTSRCKCCKLSFAALTSFDLAASTSLVASLFRSPASTARISL
jgi:predicted 3-demethylubiquinone-9 3-methyltransferase (glyoxalase superfamily)